MANCYMCGIELTEDNHSEEHIILNAIGGHLKSNNLICKKCNSAFGDKSDFVLAQQLQPFAVLLNVKRDRGETPPIKVSRSDNTDVLLFPDGKIESCKCSVEPFETEKSRGYNVTARSKKEMDRIFQKIKRKHPSATIINTEETKENLDEKGLIEYSFGEGAFVSLCKSAIGYYLYIGGELGQILELINKVKSDDVVDNCNFCYLDEIMLQKNEDGIFHTVAIIGDPVTKLLYAIIELFDFYRVIVLLSEEYTGKAIESTYCYNLIKENESEASVCVRLHRSKLFDLLKENTSHYGMKLYAELQKTVRNIEIRNAVKRVCKEINAEFEEKYSSNVPADVYTRAFASKMAREFLPYLKHTETND